LRDILTSRLGVAVPEQTKWDFLRQPGLLEQFISRPQALKDVGETGRVMVSEQFSDHARAAAYEMVFAEQVARSR
jgi:hypothetical protein